MVLLKMLYHIQCLLKKCAYYLIFRRMIIFGNKTTFRKRFNLAIEKGGKVEIGERCFFNNDCSITCMNKIKIGSGTLFGEGVKIYDHNHRFRNPNELIKVQGFSVGEVSVGDHCWIGSNVVLLKGCKIGNNCVIGAGCIIAQEIPDNTLVKMSPQLTYEVIQETFQ